ncbi:hypothetical protein C8R45DRAFT_1213062 [Mycena sanguinolenta]|nr:hypothetical protein C8R45DRAFT_1213062 [Mycena sanguinolenta]
MVSALAKTDDGRTATFHPALLLLAYILVTEVAIRAGWAHLFCLAAVMELPTFILGLSTLPGGGVMSCLRICELRTLATILAFVFPLHMMWFRVCIAGFVRRHKARVAARNSADESVVIQKTPTEIGIDGSDKSGSPPRTSSPLPSSLAGKPVSTIVQSRLDRLRVLSSTLLERGRNGGGAWWLSGPAGWVVRARGARARAIVAGGRTERMLCSGRSPSHSRRTHPFFPRFCSPRSRSIPHSYPFFFTHPCPLVFRHRALPSPPSPFHPSICTSRTLSFPYSASRSSTAADRCPWDAIASLAVGDAIASSFLLPSQSVDAFLSLLALLYFFHDFRLPIPIPFPLPSTFADPSLWTWKMRSLASLLSLPELCLCSTLCAAFAHSHPRLVPAC